MTSPQKIEVDVNQLPTLPAIAMEAIRLMESDEADFGVIAELLIKDQVLTGRILKYANSAYVGSRRKVVSVSQALSILGSNAVRSIALSSSIFDFFSTELSRREGLVNFWLHSIGVAVTAEVLAEKLGFPVPEEAYIAGLLHDLGKLVSSITFPEEFAQLQEELERKGSYSSQARLALELEQDFLGTDHLVMGKEAARWWGFPEPLARSMWLHHQPVVDTILPSQENMPQLIRFADVLCVTHNVGANYFQTSGSYSHEHYHFALENMLLHHHFTPADLEAMMAEVYTRVKTVGNTLGFWDEEEYRRLMRSANMSLADLSLDLEHRTRGLNESNRLLGAISEMHQTIHADLSLEEAAAVISSSASEAFGVSRVVCLLRNDDQDFSGVLHDRGRSQPFAVAGYLTELTGSGSSAELKKEAVQLLKRADFDLSQEPLAASGMIDLVTGGRFMAAFFIATRHSQLTTSPLMGELLVDFSDTALQGQGAEDLHQSFSAFVSAGSSAVERLLLARDLRKQTDEMAAASRKMEENQRQLFHSHRLATVGRLAAGAAHEINNPLTIISLNLQIMERLLKGTEGGEPLLERLGIISDQEERIAKIIQDLMSFARPSQPKFTPSLVAEIAGKVLAVIGDRISMVEARIENRISPELPAVLVDPMQIEQVFMNLLINAKQAMPEGGTILLDSRLENGFLVTSVTDTGEGINSQHLSRIFDPFFTTKREGEGTGLGLAICHSIAEYNGGSLRVKSELGKGTTFYLSLPVDEGGRLRALKKGLEHPVQTQARNRPEKNRILVVDDERILNDMLQESLRAAGYDAAGAYDGMAALQKLQDATFNLLILDIRMPRKDGLEVLEFVKKELPELPVLIITALASKEEIKETVRLGAYACLRKPFKLEKVLETVQRGLSGEWKRLKEKG